MHSSRIPASILATYIPITPPSNPDYASESLPTIQRLTRLRIIPGIPTEINGGNHTRQFASAARGTEAHYAWLNVSKALAAVGVRVLTDDEYFTHVSKVV